MKRFEVWLVNLEPTLGCERCKTRPAVIVSPDDLNQHLRTVIVAPLTTGKSYPFRPTTCVKGTVGIAAIDQIRTVDKRRLIRKIDTLDDDTARTLLETIAQMFMP